MNAQLILGVTAGSTVGAWSVVTMVLPVPYDVWSVVRGGLFVAFAVALTAQAAFETRSGTRARRVLGSVALAASAGGGIALMIYALSTRWLADWVVQVPEYLRDYTYHGYTSPKVYLADNYWALFRLQAFSWAIGIAGLVLVAGTAGWCIGRLARRLRSTGQPV